MAMIAITTSNSIKVNAAPRLLRRGLEDDSDLLGALAIAAVLVLLPIASDDASAAAGFAGGLAGLLLGLALAPLASRG